MRSGGGAMAEEAVGDVAAQLNWSGGGKVVEEDA
jgi:hypothetical protein